MTLFQRSRNLFVAIALSFVLLFSTACGGTQVAQNKPTYMTDSQATYQQLERGNTLDGQNFGEWVLQTGRGLIADAYVRDGNKLGAVITSQVRPAEVRSLARSLMQGFHHDFPGRDLAVLMYAPDKELILTARYDNQSNQIRYE